jgi:ATP-dependent RNA helicase DOB1
MSGRAGRRGLDASGIVILMLDEKTVPSLLRNIVKGSADPINSAFRYIYFMNLKCHKVKKGNGADCSSQF